MCNYTSSSLRMWPEPSKLYTATGKARACRTYLSNPPTEDQGNLLTNTVMKNTIKIYNYDLIETCNELLKSDLIIATDSASCWLCLLFPS